MKANPPNARFWIHWNNTLTKIRLTPDQVLTLRRHSRDEEGWSSHADRYTHEGDHVRCDWGWEGCDCDGRTGESGALICPLTLLEAEVVTNDPPGGYQDARRFRLYAHNRMPGSDDLICQPAWERATRTRRFDAYAEAAGY